MKKVSNKKGFTLAELLIVVAIIAVLVAVSIPVFGAQLNKAKFAVDVANVRAAYAEVLTNVMADDTRYDADGNLTLDADEKAEISDVTTTAKKGNGSTVAFDSAAGTITVTMGTLSEVISVDNNVKFAAAAG